MAKCGITNIGGGGGVGSDELTVTKKQVVKGQKYVGVDTNDEVGIGELDLSVITTDASDVVAGKVIVDKDGNPLTGTLALTGNARPQYVLSGQTFYSTNPKVKQAGLMPAQSADAGNDWAHATAMQINPDGQYFLGVRNGHYLNGVNWIRGYNANLIPSNVRQGVWIGNLLGTMVDYSYLMTGQTSF